MRKGTRYIGVTAVVLLLLLTVLVTVGLTRQQSAQKGWSSWHFLPVNEWGFSANQKEKISMQFPANPGDSIRIIGLGPNGQMHQDGIYTLAAQGYRQIHAVGNNPIAPRLAEPDTVPVIAQIRITPDSDGKSGYGLAWAPTHFGFRANGCYRRKMGFFAVDNCPSVEVRRPKLR